MLLISLISISIFLLFTLFKLLKKVIKDILLSFKSIKKRKFDFFIEIEELGSYLIFLGVFMFSLLYFTFVYFFYIKNIGFNQLKMLFSDFEFCFGFFSGLILSFISIIIGILITIYIKIRDIQKTINNQKD